MEDNKKFLASCFPQYVVFVEQPDLHWWTDIVAAIEPVQDNTQQEKLPLASQISLTQPKNTSKTS
jgi:hypothetical protein